PHLLETLSGSGHVYLHGPGNHIDFSLSQKENLVVDGMRILMMDADVDHAPKPVGQPGQPGPLPYILLMQLTGPGRVILHSLV
ncbi:MAG: AIM24 family protein, partial [bacterium]|nr:AIM24 family protein [bacterium]